MGKNTEVLMIRFSIRPYRCRKWRRPQSRNFSWDATDFRAQVMMARAVAKAKDSDKAIALYLLNKEYPKNRGIRIHGVQMKRGEI